MLAAGTRVLISLWDSLMFERVPGTRPNTSESHSEISTRVPFCIAHGGGAHLVVVAHVHRVQVTPAERLVGAVAPTRSGTRQTPIHQGGMALRALFGHPDAHLGLRRQTVHQEVREPRMLNTRGVSSFND